MSVAINKNLEHAIGGALHYNPKSKAIVQLLEGAEPAVRRLYANICKDPRHDDMQVIDDVPIGEGTDCVFTSFGMHIHESTSFAPSTTGLTDEPLRRLAYVSVMTSESRTEAEATMLSVLEKAYKKNPTRGIGGVIWYNSMSRQVMQELEGPEKELRELYDMIEKDDRHFGVEIISDEEISTRTHPWMGLVRGKGPDWKVLGNAGMRKEFRDLWKSNIADFDNDDESFTQKPLTSSVSSASSSATSSPSPTKGPPSTPFVACGSPMKLRAGSETDAIQEGIQDLHTADLADGEKK